MGLARRLSKWYVEFPISSYRGAGSEEEPMHAFIEALNDRSQSVSQKEMFCSQYKGPINPVLHSASFQTESKNLMTCS